jgi:hypothetical protein
VVDSRTMLQRTSFPPGLCLLRCTFGETSVLPSLRSELDHGPVICFGEARRRDLPVNGEALGRGKAIGSVVAWLLGCEGGAPASATSARHGGSGRSARATESEASARGVRAPEFVQAEGRGDRPPLKCLRRVESTSRLGCADSLAWPFPREMRHLAEFGRRKIPTLREGAARTLERAPSRQSTAPEWRRAILREPCCPGEESREAAQASRRSRTVWR